MTRTVATGCAHRMNSTDKADAAAVVRACATRAMLLLAGNQPVLALDDAEMAIRTEEKAGRRTADTEVVLAAALLRNDRPADALAAAQRATRDDPRNSGRLGSLRGGWSKRPPNSPPPWKTCPARWRSAREAGLAAPPGNLPARSGPQPRGRP